MYICNILNCIQIKLYGSTQHLSKSVKACNNMSSFDYVWVIIGIVFRTQQSAPYNLPPICGIFIPRIPIRDRSM